MKNLTYLTTIFISLLSFFGRGQAPCNTSFFGYDPCSAEALSIAPNCADASEEFRTNNCAGTNPISSSCGLTTGTEIVWGKFTVGTADTYTITWNSSNNRDLSLGLYQYTDACVMGGETEIACANAGGNGVDETISVFLAAGQYWVCGKSSGNLSAASTICVHAPSVPPSVVASDCGIGVNICTNLNFMIDPNGEGANTSEIPPSGSLGNPLYDGYSTFNPWGTSNMGCLQIDESNSTWMKVNVSGSGNLCFTFGGNNTQGGFYDWIMYPASASCTSVLAHTESPARCNWNLSDAGGTGLQDFIPSGGDPGNFEPSLPVVAGDVYIICFSNYSSVQTAVPLDFGGTAIVSCSPLPVELIDFNLDKIQELNREKTEVNWSTGTELNCDYFIVEHSTDQVNFSEVGMVYGAGTSLTEHDYSFVHQKPVIGVVNYYRLRQVDFDGTVDYGPTKAISYIDLEEDLIVYPNPSNGEFSIQVNNYEIAKIELRNIAGSVVYTERYSNHSNLYKMNQNYLEKGVYILSVFVDGKENMVKRIVIE